MPTEKRNRFRQVDDRVQHRNVDMRPFVRLHRKEGEEIHKSLECDDGIGTVVDCRNMLGRYTALETFRTQLPSSGIVAESDSEIVASADGVMHFPTAGRCDYRVDSPRRKVADQCRMAERDIGKQAERGSVGRSDDGTGTAIGVLSPLPSNRRACAKSHRSNRITRSIIEPPAPSPKSYHKFCA